MVQFFCLSFSKQAGITFTSAGEWLLNRRGHGDKTTLHFQCRSKEEASWTCLKRISFGSAVKAVKYFSFCFLRKLHCIACGLCLSSLGGAPASSKLCREEMLGSWKWVVWQREGFLQMPHWVKASKLSSHHLENSHEELEGSCQCYRDVMCDFKLPQTWHCWVVSDTPALFIPHWAGCSAERTVGMSIKLRPQVLQPLTRALIRLPIIEAALACE